MLLNRFMKILFYRLSYKRLILLMQLLKLQLCKEYYNQYGTDFHAVMSTNLYGSNDNFNLSDAHVLPALLRKVHEAKSQDSEFVTIWGSGSPPREFYMLTIWQVLASMQWDCPTMINTLLCCQTISILISALV